MNCIENEDHDLKLAQATAQNSVGGSEPKSDVLAAAWTEDEHASAVAEAACASPE